MQFKCPVCFYPELVNPPKDYAICPCCGTEFGLDDIGETHLQLRAAWIRRGMPWFSHYIRPPRTWDPSKQVGIYRAAYSHRTLSAKTIGPAVVRVKRPYEARPHA
jgi:hypothetical protein